MKWLTSVNRFSKGEFSVNTSCLSNQKLLKHKPIYSGSTKLIISTALVLFMAGCASKPVVNPTQSRLIVVPQYYTVKQGDTLSQIASRYGLDYREIARLNNIDSNYTIYTNQSLRMHQGGKDAPRIQVRTAAVPVTPAIYAQKMPAQQPATIRPQPNAPVRAVPQVSSTTPPPILPNTPTTLPSGLNWRWPAQGAIISQFNLAQDIKGIRIGGRQGDPIYAAADGEVVYASDRLTEYGNLVLIRHINGYVTAYAHNNTIVVKENDRVKAGQKIAEMGSSGTNQTMLEFQVRFNGKPINPVGLLPAR